MIVKKIVMILCGITFIGTSSIYPTGTSQAILPIQEDPSGHMKKNPAAGIWSGILDVKLMKLTLVLDVGQDTNGALKAKFSCLEQDTGDIAVDRISLQDESLKFEIEPLAAVFEGSFNGDRSEISGQFTQGGSSFPLTLKQGDRPVSLLNRPQTPKAPFPYSEEEVSYENHDAILSGTLTLPKSHKLKETFPVALLIAGSGRTDRDESLCGHKPFLVLADHLARQGIAVLRVDKRGVGKSTGNYDASTSATFADDVLAGINYLKTRKEIDPSQIGLIGHSEGGLIAPIAAAKSKDVAFIVLLAGPSVNGEEILMMQSALIQQAEGANEEAIAFDQTIRKQSFAIIKNEPDLQIAETQLREAVAKYLADLNEDQRALLSPTQVNEANLDLSIQHINTPWFRNFLTYDPASALKQVHVPVLALNGELDLQVPPSQNLPVIAKALEEAGNKDFTTKQLPKLNHLFQTCETGSIWEYGNIEETMSPSVLDLISDWVLNKTVKKRV